MPGYDYVAFVNAKKKERRKFKPTNCQIETATTRIEGVFGKYRGAISAVNRKELHVILMRDVFNRGNQLGDSRKGQFQVVIKAALDKLFEQDKIREGEGLFGLMTYSEAAHCRHRQPRPTRGQRQRQRTAA